MTFRAKWKSNEESRFYNPAKQTNQYSREELRAIANEMWNQIRTMDKMACALGYRKDFHFGETDVNPWAGMSTRMPKGMKGRWMIYIVLERAADTYTVYLIKHKNTQCFGGDFHIEDERSDVYCDELSETIYRMCNV